jgi:poly(3-hydroxyoctanoate) depolymerase
MVETAPTLPLVLFPGAGGRVEFLRPIGERLARRRETRICEYPGLGGVPADPTLTNLADLRIALEHPERLRKLVLMATSGGMDVASLGALDWRDKFLQAQPNRPTWFIDDRTDVRPELARVQHPTLLIFGDADLIAPPAIGELLLAKLPNARLEVIPGGTHDLEIEFPDLIASLIEAHLRRPD